MSVMPVDFLFFFELIESLSVLRVTGVFEIDGAVLVAIAVCLRD